MDMLREEKWTQLDLELAWSEAADHDLCPGFPAEVEGLGMA